MSDVIVPQKMLNVSHKLAGFSCGSDQLWYGWKRMWAKKGQPRENIIKNSLYRKLHKTSI